MRKGLWAVVFMVMLIATTIPAIPALAQPPFPISKTVGKVSLTLEEPGDGVLTVSPPGHAPIEITIPGGP